MNYPSLKAPPPAIEAEESKVNRILARILTLIWTLAFPLVGGTLTMLICASIWGFITYSTKNEVGWVSIGLGIAVGLVVRRLGKGHALLSGLMGGALSLLGCSLGNLLFFSGILVQNGQPGLFEALTRIVSDPMVVLPWFMAGYGVLDLPFYALAIYLGYRVASYRSSRAGRQPPSPYWGDTTP